MDIPDQFFQVDLLLADNGLVAILKKLAMPSVPAVEVNRVAGKQSAHQGRKGSSPGSDQKMGMIVQKSPCIAAAFCFGQEGLQAVNEIVPVLIVPEYISAFNATYDDVVQNTGSIQAG